MGGASGLPWPAGGGAHPGARRSRSGGARPLHPAGRSSVPAARGRGRARTPSMEQSAVTDDLAVAHELADAAAAVTLAWFGDRLPVELKGDDTPVTEVDLAAEQAIRKAVAARFPQDGVL